MINGKKVAQRRKVLNLSQDALGELVGMSGAMVGKLERGESANTAKVFDLSRALQTSPGYLMDETDDPTEGALPVPTPELLSEQLDLVSIPQIDARYSMGGGAVIDDNVKTDPMMFSRAWIRQFTDSPIHELFWIEGDGDSMMPTIGPRDILLGDRSQNHPLKSDQIWAITQYGHGMIKRLRATAEGYTILSDNPSVPPDKATDGSMHVIGRIIAVVRRV